MSGLGPGTYNVGLNSVAEKTVPTVTAEPIAAAGGARATRSVMVQSIAANTVIVYVGGPGVTAANGIELQPKGDVTLEVSDPSAIYCISGTAGQKLRALLL